MNFLINLKAIIVLRWTTIVDIWTPAVYEENQFGPSCKVRTDDNGIFWWMFWHKVKATSIVAVKDVDLGGKFVYGEGAVVHATPMTVSESWSGPTADWNEIVVGIGWRNWRVTEERNGI